MTDADTEAGRGEGLRIVFDGPPSHEAGRFVEVEDATGRSVNAGTWHERDDGLWELRLRESDPGGDRKTERARWRQMDGLIWQAIEALPEKPASARAILDVAHRKAVDNADRVAAAPTDEAPVPKLRNETIDAIEATVIRETGNGPLAGVVSSFLRRLRPTPQGEGGDAK